MTVSSPARQALAGVSPDAATAEQMPIRRTAPYDEEPGYYAPGKLWLYGNVKLLHAKLVHVPAACGQRSPTACQLDRIEAEAEQLVLSGKVLVCGIHGSAHQRAAVVPLRWGSPRIVVMSGGFKFHLGNDLTQEPFRVARLWRYQWDPRTDLAISRRAPDKLPTFANYNPTVDRIITLLAAGKLPGLKSPCDYLTRIPARS